MMPHTAPRSQGVPRPVSEPSSDSASANPMEMPAPTEAAIPTRKVSQVLCVAKAAANSGASVDTERTHQPERLVGDEALDVLPADQRQIVAEFRAIELEQHGAVPDLLVRHLVENFGGSGELLAQAFGETTIDATVLLLVADRE